MRSSLLMVLFDNMTHQALAKNSRAWLASSWRTASPLAFVPRDRHDRARRQQHGVAAVVGNGNIHRGRCQVEPFERTRVAQTGADAPVVVTDDRALGPRSHEIAAHVSLRLAIADEAVHVGERKQRAQVAQHDAVGIEVETAVMLEQVGADEVGLVVEGEPVKVDVTVVAP